jgi:hypothetical protein
MSILYFKTDLSFTPLFTMRYDIHLHGLFSIWVLLPANHSSFLPYARDRNFSGGTELYPS